MEMPVRLPADYAILIEAVNAIMRVCIFERHLHFTGYRSRAQSDFGVGKLETTARARQRNVERFAAEIVDYRSAATLHNTRYIDRCGSEFEIRVEIDRQKQCLARYCAQRPENGENIAERGASFARNNRFQRNPLCVIRTFVDDDQARAAAIRNLAGKHVKAGPVKAGIGRLTKAVCAGQVKLATAIRSAITVIVSFAFEMPLVSHLPNPLRRVKE